MVDFAFSEEQELFRRTVRDFGRTELAPRAAYWDAHEEFPYEQMPKMARLGLTGLRIPAEYGGAGVDGVTAGVAIEEVARFDFTCSAPVLLNALVGDMISNFGSEEQKRRWLPPIAEGTMVSALGLTEPDAGTDAASLRMTAVREGDEYVLNGEKSGVSMVNADVFVVLARTDPGARRRGSGISAFIVPGDTAGLARGYLRDLGCKGARRGTLTFENMRIPVSSLLGDEGQGFRQVMQGFDYSRGLIGLMCVGAAQGALEETIGYVKQRTVFGQPLGRFEAISFRLAEDATMLEAARLLCYKTLWLRDQGLPHSKEAGMAKWLAPKVAVDVIHHALLTHGHYGYTDEYDFGQRLRDVIGFEIADGTAEASKLVVVREMLGREFLPY